MLEDAANYQELQAMKDQEKRQFNEKKEELIHRHQMVVA